MALGSNQGIGSNASFAPGANGNWEVEAMQSWTMEGKNSEELP